VLHAGQIVLRDGIEDIADEQVMVGMALWEENRAVHLAEVRGFDDGRLRNVVSLT